MTVPHTRRRLRRSTPRAGARPGRPAMPGGGPDRSTSAPRSAASSRAATSLGTPFHFGTPPVGASPVSSANAVAPKLNTSAARVDAAPPGDLRRAEPRGAAAGGLRQRDRRRAEVDDHDATRAVDDQVGRFDVAVDDTVPVQERSAPRRPVPTHRNTLDTGSPGRPASASSRARFIPSTQSSTRT